MAAEWVVVGGADKGGIIVREDQATTSAQLPGRLATGAVVEERERVGDRIQYRKRSGEGPDAGWVSIRAAGKELLAGVGAAGEVTAAAAAAASQLPEEPPEEVVKTLAKHAIALSAEEVQAGASLKGGRCLDAILEQIGDRRWVLLGESTHGTHEFYTLRAALTRRLIEERGFRVVAVEGDWSACFRVNRWLGRSRQDNPGTFPSPDGSLAQALQGFDEFPEWMWRNAETRALLEWIADFNAGADEAVRWYGLDLQGSLRAPAEEVVRYAEGLDPALAAELRRDLAAFLACGSPRELGRRLATRELGERLQAEGKAPPEGWRDCEHPERLQATLERLLAELQRRNRDDFAFMTPVEEALNSEQGLDVLLSGQEYHRKRFSDGGITWNLRDQFMVSTVMRLVEHLAVHSLAPPDEAGPGIVIWAHNSHIGDARASDRGKTVAHWNLGHMIRETFGSYATFHLGFSTHSGFVHAAPDWGKPGETFSLRPPLGGSWEEAMHRETLRLREERPDADVAGLLWQCGETRCACPGTSLLHRLVGVVYRPESEREAHCTVAELSEMYDAVLHVDATTALAPEL